MVINIIMPISRKHFLGEVFSHLNNLDTGKHTVNILGYVDGDLKTFEVARNLLIKTKFNERLCLYRNKGVPSDSSVVIRRQRISDIHNEIKDHIGKCDFVFVVEDDTLVPPDALIKLLSIHNRKNVGLASGVQVGRWGFLHIGAWIAGDDIVSIPYKDKGVIRVDACGMYCVLARRESYMAHFFKPYGKTMGPDVDWGLSLRELSMQNYIDYSVRCGHMTSKGIIEVNNDVCCVKVTPTGVFEI